MIEFGNFSLAHAFESFEGKFERESLKKTIFASDRSESLQLVLEPDTGRCANLFAVPRIGVDTSLCASKDAGP